MMGNISNQRWRFCVAPMLDWSYNHTRMFWRQLSSKTMLFSEMITAQAIINGNRDEILSFNQQEEPLALQIAGSDTQSLSLAAKIVEDYAYQEINLNLGCPSDKAASGEFGACLLTKPERIGELVAALNNAVSTIISVKCRIAYDDQDEWETLLNTARVCFAAGCDALIVHARKAISNFSPKKNLTAPPLHHELVFRLKREMPDKIIVLNGGINTIEEIPSITQQCDGAMLGRAVINNPGLLLKAESELFGLTPPDIFSAIEQYCDYIQSSVESGKLHHYIRPLLGLFKGKAGAKLFRHILSHGGDTNTIRNAVKVIKERQFEYVE